jgi:hypothetical protein
MSTEFKAAAYGNTASFNWPRECAACGKPASSSLTATYAATSNAKFLGVYASWQSQPITLAYPVCRKHQLVYFVPTILTTMSLGHVVFFTAAAIGGLIGFAGLVGSIVRLEYSALPTSIALLAPISLVLWSRVFAPVRIGHFSPPLIWIRIRRPEFAGEFSKLNPTAAEVRL